MSIGPPRDTSSEVFSAQRRSIRWNTIAILAARGMDFLAAFGSVILLTRYLGPALYGEYIWLTTLILVFQPVVNFEIDKIIVREMAANPDREREILNAGLGQKVLFTLAFSLIVFVIILLLQLPLTLLVPLIVFAVAEIVFQYWLVIVSLFRARERMEYEGVLTVMYRIVYLAGLVLVVAVDGGFLAIFIVILAANLCLTGSAFSIARSRFFPLRFSFDRSQILFLVRESFPLACSTICMIALLRLDVLLLRQLSTAEQVALFHIPHSMIIQLSIIPTALVTAMYPVLSRLYQENRHLFAAMITASEQLALLLALPLCLLIYWSSPELILFMAGPSFSEANAALRLLSPCFYLFFMHYICSTILMAAGKQRLIMSMTAATLLCNIVFSLMLIPAFGATGAALSKSLAYVIYLVLLLIPIGRMRQDVRSLREMLPFALSLVAGIAVMLMIGETSVLFVTGSTLPAAIQRLLVKTLIVAAVMAPLAVIKGMSLYHSINRLRSSGSH